MFNIATMILLFSHSRSVKSVARIGNSPDCSREGGIPMGRICHPLWICLLMLQVKRLNTYILFTYDINQDEEKQITRSDSGEKNIKHYYGDIDWFKYTDI